MCFLTSTMGVEDTLIREGKNELCALLKGLEGFGLWGGKEGKVNWRSLTLSGRSLQWGGWVQEKRPNWKFMCRDQRHFPKL